MKKLIFTLTLALMAAHLFAIDYIFSDSQNEEGRTILTKSVTFADYKRGFSYDLQLYYQERYIDGDTLRTFLVGFPLIRNQVCTMTKGQRLLLKFDDDSIKELYLFEDLTEQNNHYSITYHVGHYNITPFYELTPDDLDYIQSHRIIKIRMEADWSTVGFFDYYLAEHSKVWTPSETITTLHSAILTRIQSKPHNTIYDDF